MKINCFDKITKRVKEFTLPPQKNREYSQASEYQREDTAVWDDKFSTLARENENLKLENQNLYAANQVLQKDIEKLKVELSKKTLFEETSKHLLSHIQFLLGYPNVADEYKDPDFLQSLLDTVKDTEKCLRREGLQVLYDCNEENEYLFIPQGDPFISEKKVTVPAILRDRTVVLDGIVNIPIKQIENN